TRKTRRSISAACASRSWGSSPVARRRPASGWAMPAPSSQAARARRKPKWRRWRPRVFPSRRAPTRSRNWCAARLRREGRREPNEPTGKGACMRRLQQPVAVGESEAKWVNPADLIQSELEGVEAVLVAQAASEFELLEEATR